MLSKRALEYKQLINIMSWEEAFKIAKMSFTNAQRLYHSAILLFENDYYEQAFNNLFIACEEFYKAKCFDTIAHAKTQNKTLREETLDEFVDNFENHKWKFKQAFTHAQLNIENVTLKTPDDIDDSEIQNDLHSKMESIFNQIERSNPYSQKNSSLYVGYDNKTKRITSPLDNIDKELIEDFFHVCFYVQLSSGIHETSTKPSGEFGFYISWINLK